MRYSTSLDPRHATEGPFKAAICGEVLKKGESGMTEASNFEEHDMKIGL